MYVAKTCDKIAHYVKWVYFNNCMKSFNFLAIPSHSPRARCEESVLSGYAIPSNTTTFACRKIREKYRVSCYKAATIAGS